jgi:hypothetical protein
MYFVILGATVSRTRGDKADLRKYSEDGFCSVRTDVILYDDWPSVRPGDFRANVVTVDSRPFRFEEEDEKRVAVLADRVGDDALVDNRFLNTLNGSASRLLLENLNTCLKGNIPRRRKAFIRVPSVVGCPTWQTSLSARMDDRVPLSQKLEEAIECFIGRRWHLLRLCDVLCERA